MTGELGMVHLHVNPTDVLADHNVAQPTEVLAELVTEGRVGAATDHVSVMGYQRGGLEAWRASTAPRIVDMLRDERSDGVVLAPV